MDYWRLIMYVVLATPIAALIETLWRRRWGEIADRLINVGIFSGLTLILYPQPFLRGVIPALYCAVFGLLTLSLTRLISERSKTVRPKPGPPAA